MKYPEYIFLGVVFICLAVIMFYNWFKLRRKIIDIIATPTSTIASLLNSAKTTGRIVEVKGNLVAEPGALLRSPYAEKDCVFFHSVEKEKIREVTQTRDGKRTSIRYNISENKRSSEMFYVEDHTGKIGIDPDGVEIDGQKVFNSSNPIGSGASGTMFDKFFETSSSKIIAIIKEEHILAPGKRVYVIGELFHGSKSVFIGASPEQKTTALVSIKSEDAVVGDSKNELLKLTIGWLACLIAAYVMINMAW